MRDVAQSPRYLLASGCARGRPWPTRSSHGLCCGRSVQSVIEELREAGTPFVYSSSLLPNTLTRGGRTARHGTAGARPRDTRVAQVDPARRGRRVAHRERAGRAVPGRPRRRSHRCLLGYAPRRLQRASRRAGAARRERRRRSCGVTDARSGPLHHRGPLARVLAGTVACRRVRGCYGNSLRGARRSGREARRGRRRPRAATILRPARNLRRPISRARTSKIS